MRITYIKHRDGETKLKWEHVEGASNENTEFKSTDIPDPAFTKALAALHEDVLDLLELPTEYGATLEVTGLSIRHNEKGGWGATIMATKTLAKTKGPLNLAVPFMQSRPDDAVGEIRGHFSEDVQSKCAKVIAEALAYHEGKRKPKPKRSATDPAQLDIEEEAKKEESRKRGSSQPEQIEAKAPTRDSDVDEEPTGDVELIGELGGLPLVVLGGSRRVVLPFNPSEVGIGELDKALSNVFHVRVIAALQALDKRKTAAMIYTGRAKWLRTNTDQEGASPLKNPRALPLDSLLAFLLNESPAEVAAMQEVDTRTGAQPIYAQALEALK